MTIKCICDRIRHSNADFYGRVEDVFTIQGRKKGKYETMKFSSEYSREVVSEALKYHSKFGSDSLVERPVSFSEFYYIFFANKIEYLCLLL